MEDIAAQQIVPKKASNKLSRRQKASEKVISAATTEADEEEDVEMPAAEQEGENEQAEEEEEPEAQAESAEEQQRAASRHFTELSKSAQDRAGVKFPISKLAKFAKSGKYAERIGQGVPVFMAGVLEYLTLLNCCTS